MVIYGVYARKASGWLAFYGARLTNALALADVAGFTQWASGEFHVRPLLVEPTERAMIRGLLVAADRDAFDVAVLAYG